VTIAILASFILYQSINSIHPKHLNPLKTSLALFIYEVTNSNVPAPMATQRRQRGRSGQWHLKLNVARFLDLHAAQGGIDRHAHKIAYRMIKMISAMGQDVHIIIQSKIPYITIVNRVASVAAGVLEGCEVFRQHFGERLMSVQDVAQELPMLDSLRVEALEEIMPVYEKTLK